jgi:Niemann-Pick C1 protein
MNLLCGPWGSTLCTPKRWFEFLGSTSNGQSPFDIVYHFGKEPVGGFTPHNPDVPPCHAGVHVNVPLLMKTLVSSP